MKYRYILFFITVLTWFNASAQNNFKPGYVINLKGDTIKGTIDQKEWGENPDHVSFKQNDATAIIRYSPSDILAFAVTGQDYFIKYDGMISKGAVDLADLSSGIDSSTVQSTVFLKTISKGLKITLYSYRDKIKDRYFVAEGNSLPVELNRYVFLDIVRVNKTGEINAYQQQLNHLVAKYQPGDTALMERILATPYRSEDLKKVVAAIDGSQQMSAVSADHGGSYRFFIGAGVTLAQGSFYNVESIFAAENIFNSSNKIMTAGPMLNGGIDFYFNKNVEKLLFRAEFILTMNKFHGTYTNTQVDYYEIRRDDELNINQFSASLSPQLIYNIYNKDSFKFYVAAGGQLNISSFSNNHYVVKNYLNGVEQGGSNNVLKYRSITSNIVASMGIEVNKKVNVYLKYGSSMAITNYPRFALDVTTYRAGVNYLFGKK